MSNPNGELPQNPNMLTLSIDPLKYLTKLPEFNGDSRDLQTFIDLIDKVHPLLLKYDSLSQNIFSDTIKSKLKGRARETIEINNHVTTWSDIKEILVNNFGDRLTAEELFDELRSIKFKTHCVDFYNEIKSILRRLNIRVKQDLNGDHESITNLIKVNKNSALCVFKNKVPEPMRSILHCRNPQNLEEAINILHESGYAFFNGTQTRIQNFPQNNHSYPSHNNRNEIRKNNSNTQNKRNYRNNESFQYHGNRHRNFTNTFNSQPRNNQPTRDPSQFNNSNNFSNFRNPRFYRSQGYTPNFSQNFTNTNFRESNFPNQSMQNAFSNSQPSTSRLPPPEPMEININERSNRDQAQNFRLTASTDAFHIS